MALAPVDDAFADLTENIIIKISEAGTRDHGMWVDGAVVDNPCDAVVQPMGDNEMNELSPDGDHTIEHLKFYVSSEKFIFEIGKTELVSVEYNSLLYKALRISNYSRMGGYRVIYAVQLEDQQ